MDITSRMRGKTVAAVIANGNLLEIRCHDGTAVTIAWLDDDLKPVKGVPRLVKVGRILKAEGMSEIVNLGRAANGGL